MSNNKHFADLLKVCSILPALAIMPAMAEVPEGFVESTEQAISEPMNIVGKTYENLYVRSPEETPVADQNLTNLYVTHGTKTSNISNSKFHNNNAEVGGAIAVAGGGSPYWPEKLGGNQTELVVTNSTFSENSALYDAGAIGNYGFLTIGEGVEFRNNTSVNGIDTVDYMGGGALGLGSLSTTTIDDDTKFIKNYSGTHGGAIATRRSENGNNHIAKLDIKGYFELNESKYRGGAIYNTFYNGLKDGTGVTVDADFVRNHAGQSGGAIYNDGVLDKSSEKLGAIMTINDSDFEYNTAGVNGGAIYNAGTLNVADAEFEGNVAGSGGAVYNLGNLTIENAEFEGNKSVGSLADGGALYSNTGTLKLVNTNFIDNSAEENPIGNYGYGGAIYAQGGIIDIQGGEYSGNKALFGGAIYVSKSATSANFQDVTFDGNQATGIGALGVFGKNTTLTNLKFTNNSTTGSYEYAGGGAALLVGAVAQVEMNNSTFIGNKSAAMGGAIATRYVLNANGTKNGMKDAMLDIVGGTFTGNIANTQGGAIYNTIYNSKNALGFAYVDDSTFTSNEALEGGAIYNVGIIDAHEGQAKMTLNDVTFTGNKAAAFGGAIYNEEGGTIVLTGENTFVNNTAKGGANDIHNLGTLEIASGTTTFMGGVLGDGTLTLAEGATMNIGNSTIYQSAINIDGIVKASVLSSRSYGRLIASAEDGLKIGDNAELHLSVGGVGEYDMFGGGDATFKNVTLGDSYLVEQLDNGVIKVTTKSVDDLAADTGLTTQAAGVVASLANSRSDKMQNISLALQEVLNSGNTELVERESKKLNPEDKPVAQSIASSVQNQVLSLASGRMSGGVAMGRAGGDTAQENGFWMHGLFNKSKLDDQFHGYTRGVAFGMDTVIDGKYTLGGGLAFNNSDVHSNGRGNADIDSKTLFVYGQYKPNKWFANLALTYTMSEYDEETSVHGIKLNDVYDVDSYGAQIMTGYDFATGITTDAGLRYLHIAQDEYTKETGAKVMATDTDLLTAVAGLKYAFAIENDWAIELRPELRAALTYDIISEADAAVVDMPGVASYAVDAEQMNRLGGEFGIGLTADYKGLKVTLMYDLDLHKDYTSQTGMIKFRTQF